MRQLQRRSNPSTLTNVLLGITTVSLIGAGVVWYLWRRKTTATKEEKQTSRDLVDAQAQGRTVTLADGRTVYVPNKPATVRFALRGEQIRRLWSNDPLEFNTDYTATVGNAKDAYDDEDNRYAIDFAYQHGKVFLTVQRSSDNGPLEAMKVAQSPDNTTLVVGDTVELVQAIAEGRSYTFSDDDYILTVIPKEIS